MRPRQWPSLLWSSRALATPRSVRRHRPSSMLAPMRCGQSARSPPSCSSQFGPCARSQAQERRRARENHSVTPLEIIDVSSATLVDGLFRTATQHALAKSTQRMCIQITAVYASSFPKARAVQRGSHRRPRAVSVTWAAWCHSLPPPRCRRSVSLTSNGSFRGATAHSSSRCNSRSRSRRHH